MYPYKKKMYLIRIPIRGKTGLAENGLPEFIVIGPIILTKLLTCIPSFPLAPIIGFYVFLDNIDFGIWPKSRYLWAFIFLFSFRTLASFTRSFSMHSYENPCPWNFHSNSIDRWRLNYNEKIEITLLSFQY